MYTQYCTSVGRHNGLPELAIMVAMPGGNVEALVSVESRLVSFAELVLPAVVTKFKHAISSRIALFSVVVAIAPNRFKLNQDEKYRQILIKFTFLPFQSIKATE